MSYYSPCDVSARLSNGEEYRGRARGGSKEGHGVVKFKSGDIYDGNFKDNQMNGRGIYYCLSGHSKGDIYNGQWKQGRKHGKGVYTYASGVKFAGVWKEGRLRKAIDFYEEDEADIKQIPHVSGPKTPRASSVGGSQRYSSYASYQATTGTLVAKEASHSQLLNAKNNSFIMSPRTPRQTLTPRSVSSSRMTTPRTTPRTPRSTLGPRENAGASEKRAERPGRAGSETPRGRGAGGGGADRGGAVKSSGTDARKGSDSSTPAATPRSTATASSNTPRGVGSVAAGVTRGRSGVKKTTTPRSTSATPTTSRGRMEAGHSLPDTSRTPGGEAGYVHSSGAMTARTPRSRGVSARAEAKARATPKSGARSVSPRRAAGASRYTGKASGYQEDGGIHFDFTDYVLTRPSRNAPSDDVSDIGSEFTTLDLTTGAKTVEDLSSLQKKQPAITSSAPMASGRGGNGSAHVVSSGGAVAERVNGWVSSKQQSAPLMRLSPEQLPTPASPSTLLLTTHGPSNTAPQFAEPSMESARATSPEYQVVGPVSGTGLSQLVSTERGEAKESPGSVVSTSTVTSSRGGPRRSGVFGSGGRSRGRSRASKSSPPLTAKNVAAAASAAEQEA